MKKKKKIEFKEYRVDYQDVNTGGTHSLTRVLSEPPIVGDTEFINGGFHKITGYTELKFNLEVDK